MSIVKYGRAEDVVARMPSPKIWADCPTILLTQEPAKGFHFFQDFKVGGFGDMVTTSICRGYGLYGFNEADSEADIAIQADDDGHMLLTVASDGQVCALTTGDNVAGVIRSPKKGERKRFWFETRFKINTIITNDIGFFIGLAQPGRAAATDVFGGDCAALAASIDYFGFASLEADTTGLDLVYLEGASGSAQAVADAITMAANTWYRLGMRLDVDSDIIKCYVDGVYLGTTYDIDVSSINFPSNTNMDVIIDFCGGSTVATSDGITLDWIRVAQEY